MNEGNYSYYNGLWSTLGVASSIYSQGGSKTGGSANDGCFTVEGIIVTTTSGTFSFDWTFFSSGTATVYAGAWLKAEQGTGIVSGTSGVSGYSAYSGASGTSAYSGQSGSSGTSGYSGYSGYSGDSTSGYSGYSGFSGFSGYSGYSGKSGSSGAFGGQGVSGYSGASGYSGTSGYSGASGYSGFSGTYSGFSGVSAYSGYSGYSGAFSGISGYSGYSAYSGFSASLNPLGQVIENINAKGNCTGAQTLDLSLGNVITATLTGDGTWTITNPAASGKASTVSIFLTNGGAFTITWAIVPKWVGGVAPSLTVAGIDLIMLTTLDGGTTWYGTSTLDLK